MHMCKISHAFTVGDIHFSVIFIISSQAAMATVMYVYTYVCICVFNDTL